ncbi:hypothetical protein P280DRAFT_517965 [Massarina eburnea CBS 473.64]|uniref:Uncharacterized protein n=1 Tax=Massarina eburnea CBS 473.64 TaxID=1395130 RepID=A0A6A6RZS4_9PLEO|nr:hypothetical protein P280DRAFT_517965 [Massarina eburnea CBS 473.64]
MATAQPSKSTKPSPLSLSPTPLFPTPCFPSTTFTLFHDHDLRNANTLAQKAGFDNALHSLVEKAKQKLEKQGYGEKDLCDETKYTEEEEGEEEEENKDTKTNNGKRGGIYGLETKSVEDFLSTTHHEKLSHTHLHHRNRNRNSSNNTRDADADAGADASSCLLRSIPEGRICVLVEKSTGERKREVYGVDGEGGVFVVVGV